MFKKIVLLLFIINTVSSKYDENLARNILANMAGAAYASEPQVCFNNVIQNGEFIRRYEVTCDDHDDTCAGFLVTSHTDKAIIVSFRGTHGSLQLIIESIATLTLTDSPIHGKVASYFNNAFHSVWNAGMGNDFIDVLKKYPDYKVWITGHSLGGALASIAAAKIVADNLIDASKIHLYTFGQPRTGDKVYAANFDAMNLGSVYRVTHARDIVPAVPTRSISDYTHHKNEIWYPKDMNAGSHFIECDEDESPQCKNTQQGPETDIVHLSERWKDHVNYFEKTVSDNGVNGCTDEIRKFYQKTLKFL